MSKTARPSLTSLSDRLAPKAAAARPAAEPAAASAAEPQDPEPAAPPAEGPRDLKTMMCRVNRAGWQEMSRLSIELDRNLEDLLIEACNDLLVKNGHPPVIEKRSPTRRG